MGLGKVSKEPILRGIITYKINGMYFQIFGEGADVLKLVHGSSELCVFVTYICNVMVFFSPPSFT